MRRSRSTLSGSSPGAQNLSYRRSIAPPCWRAIVSQGPALIREANATTVVEPGWTAEITRLDHMTSCTAPSRSTRVPPPAAIRPDPVLLELFNNLFMNVAEQTGAVLQNTSMSVNIKERLDFSCAIFDAQGFLVANAPHVPVHLGAMGESVRTVLNNRRDTLKPGDVVALNNPSQRRHAPARRDGHHTGVRPGGEPKFYFSSASRGHHADIGGITPGSTPPPSRTLEEEGVVIDDFLLVDGGQFREAGTARPAGRREISCTQPRRERCRHQGAGRREREGRAGTAARRCAGRLADGQRLHAPRDEQRRGDRCAG